jgi:hypothetical protein
MDSFTRRTSDADRSLANPSTVPKRKVADHGAIGNLSTMALVALDGAIDFLCWPNFDSPSIFAALLDPDVGGSFHLAPVIDSARVIQTYIPDSNVLITRWLGDAVSAEVMEFQRVSEECGLIASSDHRRTKMKSVMPMSSRMIFTALGIFLAVGSHLADYNETHIFNPRWTQHAKFHGGQTLMFSILLAALSIFSHGERLPIASIRY